jgi:hypothetical protein
MSAEQRSAFVIALFAVVYARADRCTKATRDAAR